MKQRLSSHCNIESDVRKWRRAADVTFVVLLGGPLQDVPLYTGVEVPEVDALLDDFRGRALGHTQMDQVHLIPVISPRSEFHDALLDIKGEKLYVDHTGTLVDGGRLPYHLPVGVKDCLRHQRHLVITVSVVKKHNIRVPNVANRDLYRLNAVVFRGIPD